MYVHPLSAVPLEPARQCLEPIRVEHAAALFDLFQDRRLAYSSIPVSLESLAQRYRAFATHGPCDGSRYG